MPVSMLVYMLFFIFFCMPRVTMPFNMAASMAGVMLTSVPSSMLSCRTPLCLAFGICFFMPPRWGRHYPFHTRSDVPIMGNISRISYKIVGRPSIFIYMEWGAGLSPNHLWRTQGHTNDRWRPWGPKKTTGNHTTGDHRRQSSPHRSHGVKKNKSRPWEYFIPRFSAPPPLYIVGTARFSQAPQGIVTARYSAQWSQSILH